VTKKKILESLKHNTFTRLRVSPISGIGVFAIKKIPKNWNPFIDCYDGGYIGFTVDELAKEWIEPDVLNLIHDMCVFEDGKYWLPKDCGISAIDQSWYLNHSDNPNMVADHLGENFVAKRDIEVGEELTVDYNTYNDEAGL